VSNLTRRQVLGAMGLGVVAGGIAPSLGRNHAYNLHVEKHEIKLERWDADGFKVAFLSDFHLNGKSQTERAIHSLALAAKEKPDVLILGGDFIEHDTPKDLERLRQFAKALRDLDLPILSVLGNHDYWSLGWRDVLSILKSARVQVLQNRRIEFQGVTIAGVDDAIDKRQDFSFLDERGASRSLLSVLHEPDFVEEQPRHVSLQLSGHSHGGQMCLPGGTPVHVPKYGRKYTAGFYGNLSVPLYVSRGVGTTSFDMRLFCPPEVSILTLRSG
jgi:predicted MPP superfamily phosphohydrolase